MDDDFSYFTFLESFTGRPLILSYENMVRGVRCVLLGSTEAALMGNFTPARKMWHVMAHVMTYSGARSAPLCTQAILMAQFAGRREIGVNFPMRAASVDPKSTQLTPLTISHCSGGLPAVQDLRFDRFFDICGAKKI